MNIENNVETNFSHQQRGSLSEIASESAQALEAQRHTLIHEATAEMMPRVTRQGEETSQLRSDLQCYYHHHVGQSEKFQESQAVLRQHLERSNAEGVQLRRQCEETRAAKASIAPEVVRLQARQTQLSTRVYAKSRDGGANTVEAQIISRRRGGGCAK